MTPTRGLLSPSGKPRARALGFPFHGDPGPTNTIVDVEGVEVGYVTLIEGDSIRTGVTGIHPRGKANPGDPVAAGCHSQNGNGEMTGLSWVREAGNFSGPIAITNTHSVGVAHAGIIAWTVRRHPDVAEAWLIPVAAETWDGYLNNINAHGVNEAHVVEALDRALPEAFEEGSVGGGTGMNCYEYKGGSGSASRLISLGRRQFTVGVFLQANFGSRAELTLAGVRLGEVLSADNPMLGGLAAPPGAGSCIGIVATDAPLLPNQCAALARRITLGLARTGTTGSHFSGDLFLAFSTANANVFTKSVAGLRGLTPPVPETIEFLQWGNMDALFEAVVDATEESVVNALVVNEEMIGFRDHRTPRLPIADVRLLLEGRLVQS